MEKNDGRKTICRRGYNFNRRNEKNKKETAYSDVQRILENDTVIAFIVRGEEFGKRFWGLSKKGLTDGDIDGFRTFLLQKCTGVKKGIEEIKTK